MRSVKVSLEQREEGIWLMVAESFEDGHYASHSKLVSGESVGAFDSLLDYGNVLYKNLPNRFTDVVLDDV